jgi:phenylalanyl-tRNA synthetase beta chain
VTGLTAQVRSGAPEAHPHLHPRGVGEVVVSGRWVGRFGPLHPDVLERLDVGGAAMVVEIDVAALEEVGRHRPAFTPVPTLPAVSRDLALVVSADVLAGELESVIRQAAGELCESVELFDVYSGKGVPDDHRSLAFHLVFRDPKAASDPEGARTLTDKEVDACNAQVVGAVNKLGATVRGA